MNLIELWNPTIHPIPPTARKIIRWNDAGELKVHDSTLAKVAEEKQRRLEAVMVGQVKVTAKRMRALKHIVASLEGITQEHPVLMSYLTTQHPFKHWRRGKMIDDLRLLVAAGWIGGQADGNRGWWKYWSVCTPPHKTLDNSK